MKNKVKAVRLAKKLTQRQLAELISTSQQQIQRIETGAIATRLDIATRLAAVLGQPVSKLFPGSGKALEKMRVERKGSTYVELDSWSNVRNVGLEPDPRVWTLKVGISGYADPFFFRDVPAVEKERVFSRIQNEDAPSSGVMDFVIFDSSIYRIAINVSQLTYCHFLYDAADRNLIELDENGEEVEIDNDAEPPALVHMVGGGPRLELDLDVDEPAVEDSDEMAQCRGVFYDLETACEQAQRIHLIDQDGEQILIRAGNLALLMVPLWVVEPISYEESDED